MADYTVKIFNNDLEVYQYNVKATSEAVAKMRALTLYHTVCNKRFTQVVKVNVSERKKGF